MPGAEHMMAIGSDVWPGLGKLVEECGEVGQVVGKLIAYPVGEHPDGDGSLSVRLAKELGDLLGTIEYVLQANACRLDVVKVSERAAVKRAKFVRWHREERARREVRDGTLRAIA